MLAATNGLQKFRLHRIYCSALAMDSQYRHFVATSSLGSTGPTTPEAEAAAVAAKKTGRATFWFIGVAAAAIIGVLAYPQLVTIPPPPHRPASALPPPSILPTFAPPQPTLSPREQLDQRLKALRAELGELRKQRRSQLVDMKKASIKDEIKMIESGLAKLDKA